MTEYEFPLPSAREFVERVADSAAPERRVWVIRDDNQQHYHGRVPLQEDPLLLELRWKPDTRSREQVVGIYRLHLSRLLEANFVRRESDSPGETDVRLRFHRGDRGVIFIQSSAKQPALPIGVVDRAYP